MSKHFILAGVGAVVLLGVGGLLVWLQRPTAVVERAFTELAETKTGAFAAQLALENNQATQQLLGEAGTLELAVDGVFARHDEQQDSLQADATMTAKTESVSVQLQAEFRFIGDQVYVLVKRAPAAYPALVQLKGVWLKLPRGAEQQPAAEQDDAVELFTDVDRAGTEHLDGVGVVKYDTVATDDAVVRMMDAFAVLLGTDLTEQQIQDVRAGVAQAGEVPVTVWVRRFSRQLEQLQTRFTVPGGNTVAFTLRLKERGQDVTVEEPAGAVTIQELITTLQQAQQVGTPTPPPQP